MTANPRLPALTLAAILFGVTSAWAQSTGPVEAIGPDGAVTQPMGLTLVQQSTLYNVVSRQRVRATRRDITAAVGAPVPPSLALGDLPDVPALCDDADVLKYATVERDVVVVDPIRMRVIDVIHSSAGP
jgi:hypothetical protein